LRTKRKREGKGEKSNVESATCRERETGKGGKRESGTQRSLRGGASIGKKDLPRGLIGRVAPDGNAFTICSEERESQARK